MLIFTAFMLPALSLTSLTKRCIVNRQCFHTFPKDCSNSAGQTNDSITNEGETSRTFGHCNYNSMCFKDKQTHEGIRDVSLLQLTKI